MRRSLLRLRAASAARDLTQPAQWYPAARLRKRRIIFHGGPTNSGKTFHALQRFRGADARFGGGLYLGPLRLLALEVMEATNDAGIACSLRTGQERQDVPFAQHAARTVEMADLAHDCDVAVLDEIQMLADADRGHAWSRALLGLRARELHVCGGLEAEPLVRALVESTGDAYELRRYERLTPLVCEAQALRQYDRVQAGDTVVAFGVRRIEEIRAHIEAKTPHKCCVIYGSLPSETRATQAKRFNDPASGFDVLVASDAIGMGLNLNIRRVILDSVTKWNGVRDRKIDRSLIKQIAGRAGRRNSAYAEGLATTRRPEDVAYLRECLAKDVKPLEAAGISPTTEHLCAFAEEHYRAELPPGVTDIDDPAADLPFVPLLTKFMQTSQLRGRYFLCKFDQMLIQGMYLQELPLSLRDRFTFCIAPVKLRDRHAMKFFFFYAKMHAEGRPVRVSVRLQRGTPKFREDVTDVCMSHNIIELYLWLAQRFPRTFIDQRIAWRKKEHCVSVINSCLVAKLPPRPVKRPHVDGARAGNRRRPGPRGRGSRPPHRGQVPKNAPTGQLAAAKGR